MKDQNTLWIMIANVALALVVVTCLASAVFAILREAISRARMRARLYAEIEQDLARLEGASAEALAVPSQMSARRSNQAAIVP